MGRLAIGSIGVKIKMTRMIGRHVHVGCEDTFEGCIDRHQHECRAAFYGMMATWALSSFYRFFYVFARALN